MIQRYTRPEMGRLWNDESKFQRMLEVEVAVAKAQAAIGLIPQKAAQEIAKRSKFSVSRIQELEATTKHDVIAFVSNVAENVGEYGRFVHFGMTSSDVLDTALGLQVREAGEVLLGSLERLEKSLLKASKKYSQTLCAGRTHGMHAEPTTFGLKLAGHLAEFKRSRARIQSALDDLAVCKLSGAVGTFSSQSPEVEARVAATLKLKPETVATQVVPRDRHASVFCQLAVLGGALERLAIEIRHLQRTEVGEALEGFSKGQKGSSAMPHKRNPIGSENLTGCSRLLRSYCLAALENIALWHERDISHSAVERVIFGDAFIVADYALDRMAGIIDNLEVREDRMLANMDLSQGQLMSSHFLLLLVEKGLSREDAYKLVQKLSHGLKPGQQLLDAAKKNSEVKALATTKELEEVFSGKRHLKSIRLLLERVHKELQ